jgi:hypothetical protein
MPWSPAPVAQPGNNEAHCSQQEPHPQAVVHTSQIELNGSKHQNQFKLQTPKNFQISTLPDVSIKAQAALGPEIRWSTGETSFMEMKQLITASKNFDTFLFSSSKILSRLDSEMSPCGKLFHCACCFLRVPSYSSVGLIHTR